MKSFLRTIWNASTSLQFYKAFPKNSKNPVGYFLLLNFCGALLAACTVTVFVSQVPLSYFLKQGSSHIASVYPEELVVTVSSDGIDINQDRPYGIPLPSDWVWAFDGEEHAPKNLVLFTTDAAVAENTLFAQDALIILTESTFYGYTGEGEMEAHAIAEFTEDMTEEDTFILTKPLLNEGVEQLHRAVDTYWLFQPAGYLSVIFVLSLLVLTLLFWCVRFLQLVVGSFLVWVLALCSIRPRVSFSQVFHIGVYSMTPVVLASFFVGSVLPLPFLLIVFCVWTYVILRNA